VVLGDVALAYLVPGTDVAGPTGSHAPTQGLAVLFLAKGPNGWRVRRQLPGFA
jgi:ketosteroid isomerase-like protein